MPMTYREMQWSSQKKPRAGATRVCENCHRDFYLCPSFAADPRRGRFCSRECQRAFHAVVKTCSVCGKTFSRPRGVAHRFNVCSRSCRTAATKYISCRRCGKVFRAEKHLNRAYCSETCRRPARMVACRHCGATFRAIPSDADRQFCSLACYRRSGAETLIEAIVRRALSGLHETAIQEHRLGRYSVDFFLPARNAVIEVDGAYWHRNKARDQRKNDYIQGLGIHLIRIPEAIARAPQLSSVIAALLSDIKSLS